MLKEKGFTLFFDHRIDVHESRKIEFCLTLEIFPHILVRRTDLEVDIQIIQEIADCIVDLLADLAVWRQLRGWRWRWRRWRWWRSRLFVLAILFLVSFVEEAAKQGAEIVCLPELFRSQYFCQREDVALFDLAETIPGRSTDVLGKIAKDKMDARAIHRLDLFHRWIC